MLGLLAGSPSQQKAGRNGRADMHWLAVDQGGLVAAFINDVGKLSYMVPHEPRVGFGFSFFL
jgi:hypothetical protein